MTSGDPDYFRKASIRAVVTELVERFTAIDAAKKLIIERTLLLIMENPEFDLRVLLSLKRMKLTRPGSLDRVLSASTITTYAQASSAAQ